MDDHWVVPALLAILVVLVAVMLFNSPGPLTVSCWHGAQVWKQDGRVVQLEPGSC